MLKNKKYDLVLMDLMLPGKSGEQLIKELREYSDVPVIVLSAKSMMETRLEVLRLGADDYILKPFDLDEILVRIEVVLRRAKSDGNEDGKILSCGMIKLYLDQNRAECNDKEISLTMKELSILKLFMENPNVLNFLSKNQNKMFDVKDAKTISIPYSKSYDSVK